jgi:hypothetical protein
MPQVWFNKNDVQWQQPDHSLPIAEVIRRTESGMASAWYDPEAHQQTRELFKATGGYADFSDAAHANGLADSFAGQLVVPFVDTAMLFPGCFPGSAQERGDCESHGIRSGCMMTMAGEITAGTPDEVTGKVEGKPDDLPIEGQHDMVLSSEWSWWWRGYNGDGWYLDAATAAVIKHGCMLRKAYPDLGIDLTRYSYSNTAKYGSRQPPENMDAVGRVHVVTSGADINSFEELRDALGNRHGIPTEGGEGFSSTRDQYGMSPRRGSWSHAYPFIGADDRPKTREMHGDGLVLNLNNWGPDWNSGPRDIYDSASLYKPELKNLLISLDLVNPATGNLMIPKGSWWCRWRDVKNRGIKALAGFRGWTKKQLPDWGSTGIV